MASTPKATKKSMAGKIIGQTAKYIGDGTLSYFTAAMPTTSSILRDAKSTVTEVTSKLKTGTQSIATAAKGLKNQNVLKGITNWYLQEEAELDDMFDGSDLDFDIPTDDASAELAVEQISETKQSADQITATVLSSSRQMLEGQMQLTANIMSSMDKQTAVITTGFNQINDTLGKIAEMMTANQEALIKATNATTAAVSDIVTGKDKNIGQSMLSGGKFSLNEYKKMIGENIKNDPTLGMLAAFAPMLKGDTLKMLLTPDSLISAGIGAGLNKLFPDMQKTLKSMDKMVNDEIMNLLVNIGDTSGSFSGAGILGSLFGIKSDRKVASGIGREKFDVKAAQFDTLTREAIITTIPGYLQKILAAISGEDTVYDMRTRSFRSKRDQAEEFRNAMTKTGNIHSASNRLQNVFGTDAYAEAFYDLMMTDLGSLSATNGNQDRSSTRKAMIQSLGSAQGFNDYATNLLDRVGIAMTQAQQQWIEETGAMLEKNSRANLRDITTQVAKTNVDRNRESEEYMRQARLYNVDLSGVNTTSEDELRRIAKNAGFSLKSNKPGQQELMSGATTVSTDGLDGVNYTNQALYEMFRLMYRGINVYQVGQSKDRKQKFDDDKLDKWIKPPKRYRPQNIGGGSSGAAAPNPVVGRMFENSSEADPNLLNQYETDENGDIVYEDDPDMPGHKRPKKKSRGERFKGWAGRTGRELKSAVMSGDPTAILSAFGHALRDVRELGEDAIKTGAKKVNTKFGNVSGYVRHKLTGKGYTYINEKGELVQVDDNRIATGKKDKDGNEIMKSGGLFGFARDYMGNLFKPLKEKGKNWFQSVAKYFDFGDKDGDKTAGKRKRFIMASVGAMAGAGILGGPIGLLMGAVAGHAFSAADIGNKIKGIFFGRDKKGKPTGLFTKLGDAIVNPLRFQFHKTMHHLGDKLKKNIVGPLSDIGYAIKERVSTAAKKVFGPVFKKIGGWIMAPFKGVAKLIMAPFKLLFKGIPNMLGGLARGTITGATGAVGFGLNRVADIIAGGKRQKLDENGNRLYIDKKTGESRAFSKEEWNDLGFFNRLKYKSDDIRIHDGLKERRKARNKEIDIGNGYYKRNADGQFLDEEGNVLHGFDIFRKSVKNENHMFAKWNGKEGYKQWLAEDQAKRAEMKSRLDEYTQERVVEISSDTNEEVQEIASTTQEISTEIGQQLESTDQILEATDNQTQIITDRTEGLEDLIDEGLHGHSIHVQDDGLRESVDQLISLVGGSQSISGVPDSRYGVDLNNDFTGSPDIFESDDLSDILEEQSEKDREATKAAAATQMIHTSMTQGEVGRQETNIADSAEAELISNDPNNKKLAMKVKEMNRLQLDDKDKAEEKQETIWDKLFGLAQNLLGGLFGGSLTDLLKLGGIAGILMLLWNWFTGTNGENNLANVIKTLGNNVGSAFNNIFNPDENAPSTSGVNAALNLIGVDTPSLLNLTIPGVQLNHVNTTAGGQNIRNYYATQAKDAYLLQGAKQAVGVGQIHGIIADIDQGISTHYTNKLTKIGNAHQAALDAENWDLAAEYENQWQTQNAKLQQKANKWQESSDTHRTESEQMLENAGTSTIKQIGKSLLTMGAVQGIGMIGNSVGSHIAREFGMSEEDAARVGNVTQSATSAVAMLDVSRSSVNKNAKTITNKLSGLLTKIKDFVAKKFPDLSKKLSSLWSKISSGFMKITGQTAEKVGAEAARKTGMQSVSAFLGSTPGVILTVGIGALNGFVNGTIGCEYLFGVLPYQADEKMYEASQIVKTIFGGLDWSPIGMALILWYAADAVFNGLGMSGPSQWLADGIYQALGGDQDVIEGKRQKFDNKVAQYNKKFGSNLNRQEFNDLINNQDWIAELWYGKAGGADDNYDVMNSIDDWGNRKLKEGTFGYGLTNLLTGGEYGATMKRNEQLKKATSFMPTEQDEAEWVVDANWGTASEVYESMPEELKKKYDELGLTAFANSGDEEYAWAQNIAFASMNTRKAVQQGIWKENEDGTIDKGNSQTVEAPTNLSVDTTSIQLRAAENSTGTADAPWMWTDEDRAKWKVIPGMPEAYELRQQLPEPYRSMDLKELYESGYTVSIDGQNYNAAKMLAFASMNASKAFEEGLWTYNDDGTTNKGTAPTQELDISAGSSTPAEEPIGGGMDGADTGMQLNPEDFLVMDDEGNTYLKTETGYVPIAMDEAGNTYAYNSATGEYIPFSLEDYINDMSSSPISGESSLFDGLLSNIDLSGVTGLLQNLGIATEGTAASIEGISTQLTNSGMDELIQAGLEEGSIYTHDQGVHEYLGRIENGIASIYNDLHNGIPEKEDIAIKVTDEMSHEKIDKTITEIKDLSDYMHSTAVGVGQALIEEIPNRISDAIGAMGATFAEALKHLNYINPTASGDVDSTKKDIFGSLTPEATALTSKFASVNHTATKVTKPWWSTIFGGPVGTKESNTGIGGNTDPATNWMTGGIPSTDIGLYKPETSAEVTPAEADIPATQAIEPGGNPTDKDVTVSLGYGGLWGDVYTKDKPHGGIDMYPTDGSKQANIVSRWNGIVTYAVGNRTASGLDVPADVSTGNNVSILTTNPITGEEMTVRHMHMKPNTVPQNILNAAAAYQKGDLEGAKVNIGDKIGEMGTTGMSSGVHLHYQMNRGNVPTAGQRDATVMDPTPYFSTVKDSSGINYGTAPEDITYGSQSLGSADDEDSNKGALEQLTEKIQEFGNAFLYAITGGLIGSKKESEKSSTVIDSSTWQPSGTTSTPGHTNANRLLSVVRKEVGHVDPDNGINKYNNWMYGGLTEAKVSAASKISITEALEMCTLSERMAYNKVGEVALDNTKRGDDGLTNRERYQQAVKNYQESGSMLHVYQGDTLLKDIRRYKNWNVTFILWAFNQCGAKFGCDSDLPEKFIDYVSSNAKKYNWSILDCGKMDLKSNDIEPGDIVAIKGFLRSIPGGAPSNLQKDINGNTINTNETTVDTYTLAIVESPVENTPGAFNIIIPCVRDSYNGKAKVINTQYVIAGKSRCTLLKVCEGMSMDSIMAQVIEKGDAEPVWAALKALGYTDEQAAGILGNIYRENGIRSRAIEGDIYGYKSKWDDSMYSTIVDDRSQMDDYVQNGLFPFYARNDVGILKDAYKHDGHYYTGMGFVGFTGAETKRYLDWLKSNAPGHTWDEGGAQLTYMDERIRTDKSYDKLKRLFNEDRGPAEMARAFYTGYEMPGHSENHEWATKAANEAVPIYNEYKGLYPDVEDKRLMTPEEEAAMAEAKGQATGGGKGGSLVIPKPAKRSAAVRKGGKGGGTIVPGNYKMPRIGGTRDTSNDVTYTPGVTPNINPDTPTATPYTASNLTADLSVPGTDLTELMKEMGTVAKYLSIIAGNTAESNDQLSALNEKEFGVDSDLRATLSAAAKVKTHKTLSKGANTNSMKGIVKLARP